MTNQKTDTIAQSESVKNFLENGSGIITLCGSTKFFFEAMEAHKLLTFQNWAIFQCGSWGHSFDKYSIPADRDYSTVKKLHFHKIMLSQAIVVVTDQTNYFGSSTRAEIAFAQELKKSIFYFDGVKFSGFSRIDSVDSFADSSLIYEFEISNNGLGF